MSFLVVIFPLLGIAAQAVGIRSEFFGLIFGIILIAQTISIFVLKRLKSWHFFLSCAVWIAIIVSYAAYGSALKEAGKGAVKTIEEGQR